MAAADLTADQARYLSMLAAQDIKGDRERGMHGVADRHLTAWEALQPACEWEEDDPS